MKRVAALSLTLAALAALALVIAEPSAVAAPPLGALPSIARVRIDVAREHVIVIEEVDLPRGDWRAGDLDFYVAFGAPGAPEAFDAHLLAVADGALEPVESDTGDKLSFERAPRRPAAVHELLGPEEMAGVIVHVPEGSLRRALAPGGMAAIRLRSLLRLPEGSTLDARAGREVLVRLGEARTTPLTLGRVQIASIEKGPAIVRAEAHLCGPEADPWPLAISIVPRPTTLSLTVSSAPIAPVLAVRHPSDGLCVRFWSAE